MNYPKTPDFVSGENEMVSPASLKNFGITEFSEQFDYVMVFKAHETEDGPGQTDAAKTCMTAMLAAGLEIYPYLSCQKDEIYVLIRAPVSPAVSSLCSVHRTDIPFLLHKRTDS